MTISFYVQGVSTFQYYRDGNLWYLTQFGGLLFPVPIEDIGNATFNNKEKSLLMMRYIRRRLKDEANARDAASSSQAEKSS